MKFDLTNLFIIIIVFGFFVGMIMMVVVLVNRSNSTPASGLKTSKTLKSTPTYCRAHGQQLECTNDINCKWTGCVPA